MGKPVTRSYGSMPTSITLGLLGGLRQQTGPAVEIFIGRLIAAIEAWPNVQTVALNFYHSHERILSAILTTLLNLSSLRHLIIDGVVVNEQHASILAKLGRLEAAQIYSPSKALVHVLPQWLGRSRSPAMRQLHLTVC